MPRRVPFPLLIAMLVAAPVLFGVAYSALAVLGLTGAGASSVADADRLFFVLGDRTTWRATSWSLYVACTSTVIAAAAAVAIALLFPSHSRSDRVARSLATLPLPVPHLVAAATALFVLSQSGLLARALHGAGVIDAPANMPALVYDSGGVALILSLAWKELPFLAVVAIALRAGIARDLEDAARTLGATPSVVARTITWPLLWRGLFPAVIATFVFAFGSFESAVLLAPIDPAPLPVLTMERFADPQLSRRGEAYGLALVALGVAAIAVAAHEVARARWGSLVK